MFADTEMEDIRVIFIFSPLIEICLWVVSTDEDLLNQCYCKKKNWSKK